MKTMQRALAGFAVAALLVGAAPARAENPKDLSREILSLVLDHMETFECGGAKCAPATAEEKANPPVAYADANRIVERGMLSGFGMHCGLDWETRNFVPMMAYWRHDQKRPVRHMAMIAGLHGVSQGVFLKAAVAQGPCTPELKAQIAGKLDFTPEAMK